MKDRIILILLFACVATVCRVQTNRINVPKPPTEKLKIFQAFFGNYEHTMEYSGMKFKPGRA